MAKLYICEYAAPAHAWPGAELIQAPQEPAITDQAPITVGAAASSSAFNGATRLIRVHTDAICSIVIGPEAGTRRFTGSSGAGTFTVGHHIYVGLSWALATKRGIITEVGGSEAAPVITYTPASGYADFALNDAVKEWAGTADGDATCTGAAPSDYSAAPTPKTTHSRMAANATEFFGVVPGHYLSVISNT